MCGKPLPLMFAGQRGQRGESGAMTHRHNMTRSLQGWHGLLPTHLVAEMD